LLCSLYVLDHRSKRIERHKLSRAFLMQAPDWLEMEVEKIVDRIFDGADELSVWEFNRRMMALIEEEK